MEWWSTVLKWFLLWWKWFEEFIDSCLLIYFMLLTHFGSSVHLSVFAFKKAMWASHWQTSRLKHGASVFTKASGSASSFQNAKLDCWELWTWVQKASECCDELRCRCDLRSSVLGEHQVCCCFHPISLQSSTVAAHVSQGHLHVRGCSTPSWASDYIRGTFIQSEPDACDCF